MCYNNDNEREVIKMIVRNNNNENYPIEVLDYDYNRIILDRWFLNDNQEWEEFIADLNRARKRYLKKFSENT